MTVRVGSALLVVLVIVGLAVAVPRDALASTPMAAACNANLRAGPSTGDAVQVTITAGTQVGVEAVVAGGVWSATCAGVGASGSQWYQISEVNGQSVATGYGLAFLYGATGLFTTAGPAQTPSPVPTVGPSPSDSPSPSPGVDVTPTPSNLLSPTPSPTPEPTLGPVLEGIDVSHWQGAIDWSAVAASGKRFAFMKASEGTTLADENYLENRAQANGVGLFIGAYHFARPSADPGDAIAEADHFIDTARPAAGDLLPVLDLEDSGRLATADLQAWVTAFLGRVYERTGVHGLIYVSPNFWKNYMGDSTWFAANGYSIVWVAHWTTSNAPIVPAANWGGLGWTFWQYTSSGQVGGIAGRVDLDRFNGLDLTPALIPGNIALPSQAAPALSLVSTPLVTDYRNPVTSVAQLTPLGSGRSVQLQRLGAADADWVTVANLTTDAVGTAKYSATAGYNAQYRAVWPGAPDLSAATSTTTSVAVRYAVRLPAAGSTRTVSRGTRVTYTATERPLTPGGQGKIAFLIYRRVGGVWTFQTSATIPVDATGKATFTWRWRQPGEWYVRARANTTLYNAASLSPIAVVKVR